MNDTMNEQVRVANVSGGPLGYNYPVHSVSLHFGLRDKSGSEHTVDGKSFPGEVSWDKHCELILRTIKAQVFYGP